MDELPPDNSGLWKPRLAVVIVILIVLVYVTINTKAATDSYCLISVQPYGFFELDHLPYQELQPLDWNNQVGFTELKQAPNLVYTILPGTCTNIIQVYRQDKQYYMMQFRESRGRDGQPHPSDTAWITHSSLNEKP